MRKGCGKIHQSINTFTDDKRKLAQHPPGGKKKATLILIPSIRFTKLIIFHLQRLHNFHPRPESPLHLPTEEPVLGHLKFSASSEANRDKVAETAEISTTNRGAGMGGKRKWGEEQAGRSREDSTSLYAELGLYGSDTESDEEMPSVARPNPDDVAESLPLPTPGVLAGPNLEHSDVEITNPTSQPQPEHMDEGSTEKIVEEEAVTQEEREEVVKEPAAKRKKSIPRKTTRKRQKLEEDTEKDELKRFLDIVPREEAPIEIESLSTKFPIVDWKTCVLTETFMYYQVFRGDGSSKNYKVLSEMLEDFDRMDVEELFRLVKERYSTSAPEGFDLMLWGDLHTLFEHDEDDEIWKDQHEYNLLSWRLCDFCGIHILLMDNGLAIHMLTEKKYPLSQEMLSKMLSRKLEVDHESSQAFELLRFIRAQVQK
ncbi:hypothetical protein Tco_1227133 [Tanacetum coccineum]